MDFILNVLLEGQEPEARFSLAKTDVPKSKVVFNPGEKYETLRRIGTH